MARSRWMFLPFALGIGLVPAMASAVPTLDLSWDNCAPLISSKVPGPGESVVALYCSATGVDITHIGYDIRVWFATSSPCAGTPGFTPDAWRFDHAGCQAGYAQVVYSNPQGSCPPLSSPQERFTQWDFLHGVADAPPGVMRARVYAEYPFFPQPAAPGLRQHAFALRFDHEFSVIGGTPGVDCGGYERGMCFSLRQGGTAGCVTPPYVSAVLFDEDGQPVPFAIGEGMVSFGLDPATAAGCFQAVPAHDATWGAIKAQYR